MVTEANSINAATTGIVGNTGTAFTGTAVTQYNVIVGGSTSSTLSNVAPSATSGIPLVSGGSSANPSFTTAVVAGGGTGQTTLTAHGVLVGNGTTAITQLSVGANSTVLQGATGADPAFTATPTVTSITLGSGSALSTFNDTTSWTPAILFGGGSTGVTYSARTGLYSRIGNIVYINASMTLTSKGSSTGTATVTLPFTTATSGVSYGSVRLLNVVLSGGAAGGRTVAASSTYTIFQWSATGTADLADTNFQDNSVIQFSIEILTS